MNSITLDTNAYSNFVKGDLQIIDQIKNSDIVFVPTIVVGELYVGFYQGNKLQVNERILDLFLNNIFVNRASIQINTAKIYGKIFSELLKKGKPIPTNDIWIAASAIETNSTLVTYDKHFLNISTPKGVADLKLWAKLK